MFERAVTVDMIFADIDQDTDGRIERRREIDLVGRHLDHMHAPLARRLQRQDRGADIAAHLGVVPCHPHQMRDQCGGGGLAVGAGDRDERRVRRVTLSLATEQLYVADHLDASSACHQHAPMRRGMGQRRARRQYQRGKARPVHGAQIGGDEAGFRGVSEPVGAVVACDHFGAARPQRMTACKAGAAEAEHRNHLARKGSDGDQDITAASASRGRRAPASPR